MQTDTPQTKELLRKYMRKNGYRFSVERFRIVDRLLELSGEISVPDFFEYLCSRKDFFAISTIYRNFIFFEKVIAPKLAQFAPNIASWKTYAYK